MSSRRRASARGLGSFEISGPRLSSSFHSTRPSPRLAMAAHIDLTHDEDDDMHASKRVCLSSHYPYANAAPALASSSNALYASRSLGPSISPPRLQYEQQQQHQQLALQQLQLHRQQLMLQARYQQQQQAAQQVQAMHGGQLSAHAGPPIASSSRHVIDLTASRTPSPPPRPSFAETPPNTPVCIGQVTVTALVLYPVDYLKIDPTATPPNPLADEWAPVRLRCEDPEKRKNGDETIHIHVPQLRLPDGQIRGGEGFGVVEQKVANVLAPMLSKALIKVDARVRRAVQVRRTRHKVLRRCCIGSQLFPFQLPPILPLEMLVFTPKGNIQIVSGFFKNAGLLLDHPAPDNSGRIGQILYSNPHNPPPGGFRNARNPHASTSRWASQTTGARNVEVQRSQVDELFKNMQGGDDLPETEPSKFCFHSFVRRADLRRTLR